VNDLEHRIKRFALRELEDRMRALAIPPDDLNDEFNLVDSGAVDSMGFVELVGRLEQEFGLEVDFEGTDPADFTALGGLVRCVARGTRNPSGPSSDHS